MVFRLDEDILKTCSESFTEGVRKSYYNDPAYRSDRLCWTHSPIMFFAYLFFYLSFCASFVPASARPVPRVDDGPPQQSRFDKPTMSLDTAISVVFNSVMLLQVASICIACQQMRAVLHIAASRSAARIYSASSCLTNREVQGESMSCQTSTWYLVSSPKGSIDGWLAMS
jgi:hypothetical protein